MTLATLRTLAGCITTLLATGISSCSRPPAGEIAQGQEQNIDSARGWQPVTFTSATLRAQGITTGDGAQWFRSLGISPADGNFMLWGTDVGGLFRSIDGGANWEPCNVGFDARGTSAVAFDPYNPERVLVAGGNSFAHAFNGIYLSENRAASWKRTLSIRHSSGQDVGRTALAFDPTSFDPALKQTQIAYWSMILEDKPAYGPSGDPTGFFRSRDGGHTWERAAGADNARGARLLVHPQTGHVFAATAHGLLRSADQGDSWHLLLDGEITGLASDAAGQLWICRPGAVLHSGDHGTTWQELPAAAALARPNGKFQNIAVSPAHPSRLALDHINPEWNFIRYYSHDGGITWHRSAIKRNDTLVPSNQRTALFSFHPTRREIILAPGGDYPALSRDGGATYALAGNGVNNLLIGGAFNFNPHHPDLLFLGSQDYGTLVTRDGGYTWTYHAAGGKSWGGFNYGAYAPDPETLLVGDSESWGGKKELLISRDAGKNWKRTGLYYNGEPYIAYSCPHNPDILFASSFRSTDRGVTWKEMKGATHVLGHDPVDGSLFGIRRSHLKGVNDWVVRSTDNGETWQDVFLARGTVQDLAFHSATGIYHVVTQGRLEQWKDGHFLPQPAVPPDQEGEPRVRSVALDPADPLIVYLAANRDRFSTSVSALRSDDGGKTWTNITRQEPLDGLTRDGGREAQWVRVHPQTREAWFATGCYGVWKYRP